MKGASEAVFCGWGCPRRYWGETNHAPERFRAAIRAVSQAARWEPAHERVLEAMVANGDAIAIREWAESAVWQGSDKPLRDADPVASRVRGGLRGLADLVEQEAQLRSAHGAPQRAS